MRLTRDCERLGADCPISDDLILTKFEVSPNYQ